MKKVIYAFTLSLLLFSCNSGSEQAVDELIEKQDLAAIKQRKEEIAQQYLLLSKDLKKLDDAIERLDPLNKIALVTVFQVTDTLFNHYVELQGSVETKQNVVIFPEYSGMLEKVYVTEGQNVRKGQLLAQINDGGLTDQLNQARTQNELARTTYERQKRLWEQKIGSEIQFLQAKAAYEAGEQQIAQIGAQLERTRVRAPFDGIVDDVIAEQGSIVSPNSGEALMRIVNLSDMYVTAEVPERYLPSIHKGTEVILEMPVIGKKTKGKVRQVSNFINPFNRSFKIEVSLPKGDGMIRPNLTAKLSINDYSSKNSILLPLSILSENANGEQYVYLVHTTDEADSYLAKKVIVKTGLSQGDYVEIVEGLEAGDRVIKEGARSVEDGEKVRVKSENSGI